MSQTLTPPPGAAGGMMGGDPMAGAAPGGDADADSDDQVVVTICKDGQGGYVVYAGDEPDSGGSGDMDDGSEDDADALGPAGAAPAPGGDAGGGMGGGNGGAPQGEPAPNKGAALKLALDIMTADEANSGAPSADDNFASGFGASKPPTPSKGIAQKFG
jgi:hypothetical protein